MSTREGIRLVRSSAPTEAQQADAQRQAWTLVAEALDQAMAVEHLSAEHRDLLLRLREPARLMAHLPLVEVAR